MVWARAPVKKTHKKANEAKWLQQCVYGCLFFVFLSSGKAFICGALWYSRLPWKWNVNRQWGHTDIVRAVVYWLCCPGTKTWQTHRLYYTALSIYNISVDKNEVIFCTKYKWEPSSTWKVPWRELLSIPFLLVNYCAARRDNRIRNILEFVHMSIWPTCLCSLEWVCTSAGIKKIE